MKPDNRELFAHLALALARYSKEIRKDGIAPPAELLSLAEFFSDCARMRQDTTTDAPLAPSGHGEAMNHALLTKREGAAELRISVRQLERVLADESKALTSVRIDGAVRIRRVDLDAYVASLTGARSFRDQITEKSA